MPLPAMDAPIGHAVLVERFKLLNLVQRVARMDVEMLVSTVGLEALTYKGQGFAHLNAGAGASTVSRRTSKRTTTRRASPPSAAAGVRTRQEQATTTTAYERKVLSASAGTATTTRLGASAAAAASQGARGGGGATSTGRVRRPPAADKAHLVRTPEHSEAEPDPPPSSASAAPHHQERSNAKRGAAHVRFAAASEASTAPYHHTERGPTAPRQQDNNGTHDVAPEMIELVAKLLAENARAKANPPPKSRIAATSTERPNSAEDAVQTEEDEEQWRRRVARTTVDAAVAAHTPGVSPTKRQAPSLANLDIATLLSRSPPRQPQPSSVEVGTSPQSTSRQRSPSSNNNRNDQDEESEAQHVTQQRDQNHRKGPSLKGTSIGVYAATTMEAMASQKRTLKQQQQQQQHARPPPQQQHDVQGKKEEEEDEERDWSWLRETEASLAQMLQDHEAIAQRLTQPSIPMLTLTDRANQQQQQQQQQEQFSSYPFVVPLKEEDPGVQRELDLHRAARDVSSMVRQEEMHHRGLVGATAGRSHEGEEDARSADRSHSDGRKQQRRRRGTAIPRDAMDRILTFRHEELEVQKHNEALWNTSRLSQVAFTTQLAESLLGELLGEVLEEVTVMLDEYVEGVASYEMQ